MTVTLIPHWLAVAASIALGLLVFATNPLRFVNQCFLVICLVLALWLTFLGIGFVSRDMVFVGAMVRSSSATAAWIPALFNMLRLAMTRRAGTWREAAARSAPWLLGALAVCTICFTPFFLESVRQPSVTGGAGFPEPVYGRGIHVFGAYLFVCLIVLHRQLIRDTRSHEGIQRLEIQYTMLGSVIGIFFGVCVAVVVPVLTGSSQSAQLLPFSVIALDGIIAYGIATRRIMDVPYVLQRLSAYVILTIYLVLLYAVVWQLTGKALSGFVSDPGFPAHLLAALAVAFSLAPANGRMQRLANQLFVNVRSIDLTETVQKANRILSSIATRDDLLDQFAGLVAHAFGTDRVLILLRENPDFVQRYPLHAQPRLQLRPDNALIQTLRTTSEPLVADVMVRFRHSAGEQQAGAVMNALQAAIVVGINPQAGLDGIILLGPRLSGRIYGSTEQRVLQVLCNQLAVGLENAELYTRLQDTAIYNNILVDSLVSGVIAAGADRRITVYNREAQRIMGHPSTAVLHEPIACLPEPLRRSLEFTFENGRGSRDVETTLHVKGDDTPIRLGTSLFHSHTGKVLGALLVFDDLTAIKKLESQVRRTDRLASIGTLSAGMAHEIKNPLVTLKTFTQLLPERYEDSDFRETFAALVGQEVKRIDSIVNQLLRFARPAKPSLMPTHIHDVVDNTLRLVQQQLKQKNIVLRKAYGLTTDLIQGDADLLVQAFLNFFLNALDAMEEGGELTVSTSTLEQESSQTTFLGIPSTEPYLRLSIRDTGKGIRPEDVPHVFDPFFTTKSSGTGLGLSVSHGIIHEHHGVIDLESEVGSGTTFHLLFPLLRNEAPV